MNSPSRRRAVVFTAAFAGLLAASFSTRSEVAAAAGTMGAPGFCQIDAVASTSDYAAALELYRSNQGRAAAAAFARVAAESDAPAQRSVALIAQARALKVLACDSEAMAALDQAMHITDGREQLASVRCHAQGRLARLTVTRDVAAADALALRTLACTGEGGPNDTGSEAHTTRAIVALTRSEYASAAGYLSAAIEQAGSELALAEALRIRGNLLMRIKGSEDEARQAFAASAEAAARGSDPEALALALLELADSRLAPADRESTNADVDTALALAEAGELRRVVARAWYNTGARLLRRETARSLMHAAQELERSAALYHAIGDRSQERAVQLELSSARMLSGDASGAKVANARARELALEAGLVREASKSDQLLGTLARIGEPPDLPLAYAMLSSALVGLRASGEDPGDVAQVLNDLAAVELEQGRDHDALRHLSQALLLVQQATGVSALHGVYASYGWVAWKLGMPEEAQAAWRVALESPRPQTRAHAWWGLAQAARQQSPQLAVDRYASAVAEVERLRPERGSADAEQGVFHRFSELYREFAALLIESKRYAQAHRVGLLVQREELIERKWSGTRGDALVATHGTSGAQNLDFCGASLAKDEKRLLEVSSSLHVAGNPEREACCRTAMPRSAPSGSCAAEGELGSYCAQYGELSRLRLAVQRGREDCTKQIEQAAAKERRVDVQFAFEKWFHDGWGRATDGKPIHLVLTIVADDRLHVLVRGPGDEDYRASTREVSLAQIQKLVTRLRDAWEASAQQRKNLSGRTLENALAAGEANLRPVLQELYELLFAGFDPPALPVESGVDQVVAFVLDRVLREVPMAALHDGKRYLGERFATVLVTQTSTTPGATARPDGGALVMGVSKPDLPFVEGEVAEVARVLGTTAYLNEQSTSGRVFEWLKSLRAEAPAMALHLASHATLGGTKMSSQLRLWNGDNLSGIDLDDLVRGLRRVQLVVLSACRSAGTENGLALGLAGIAERGAASVLGSLWNVDDSATSRLMVAFYADWRRDPTRGVALALAKAQRDVMRQQPNPYFWAPFVVVGRWD